VTVHVTVSKLESPSLARQILKSAERLRRRDKARVISGASRRQLRNQGSSSRGHP
jgi:hypothetical protein